MKAVPFLVGIVLVGGVLASEENPPPTHDHQDIKKTADTFLQRQNDRRGTGFIATDPNSKIIVRRCSVPLQAAWAERSDGQGKKSVRVTCPATSHDKKGWRVFIPITTASTSSKK